MKSLTQNLKQSGIYCIINISNNKRYIGSSKNIYQRLQKHRSLLRNSKHQNSKLQNAWNKSLELNFEYYILEYCSEELLENKEQFYINTLNPEYNITLIVERNILSKESRILQSNTRKRKIASGEIKLSCEKKIHQYNLNGEFLKTYESIKKASKDNNIHQSTIHRFLNGKYKKGGGYLWDYTLKNKLNSYVKIKKNMSKLNKKIQIIDYQNLNIIYNFNSIKECAEYFNTHTSSISYAIKVKQCFKKKYMIVYTPA